MIAKPSFIIILQQIIIYFINNTYETNNISYLIVLGFPLLRFICDQNSTNMNRNLFFTISPEEFSEMVSTRDFTLKGKYKTLSDITNALHIKTDGAVFDIKKGGLLCECASKFADEDWKNISFHEIYKKYCIIFYGNNELFEKKRKSLFQIIMGHSNDKTLILLFFAALLSLMIGLYKIIRENDVYAWVEGASILLAIVIIVFLGTINEYSQANLFERLDKKRQNYRVKIYKNYSMDTIRSLDLSVGEIVYLEPGDIVPADCLLLTEDEITTDESMISGEGEAKSKSIAQDPFLISGSYLTEGSGKAIVICTGKNSVKGKIIEQMNVREKKTPLELKIEDLAANLAEKAFIVAIILLVCHLIKIAVTDETYDLKVILALIIESISIVIMAVPEGLPMAVTLALSFGTKRMLRDNNLVKDISACETMNNTNYICTDKTGTLTHNEMTIRYLFVGNRIFYINERKIDTDNDFCAKIEKHTSADLTYKNMILNSSAFENSENNFIGSKSESAILKILKRQMMDYRFVRREFKIVRKKPFSSKHKYMSTMIELNDKYYIFFKGAPEILEKHCINENSDGKMPDFNPSNLHKFIKKCDRRCYRIMSFCYAVSDVFDPDAIHLGKIPCTFLCAVAMEDPLRHNVKEEIDQCRQAGINIVMLTGDKMAMAEHLAIRLGILTPETMSITGHSFREKSDEELAQIIDKIKVVARAAPEDKKRFVEILQSKGNIVAVTGDGTNDGPALKTANVGFGMGISGTDIAKEASSVILMDDNFSSLVRSIEWGRCVNNSVRKFIQFQLTTTITTIVIAIFSSLLSKPGKSSFSPLKLLWINIVMDTFAALALSTDKPNKRLLKRMPESQFSPIITEMMKVFIISTATYQFFIMGLLYITQTDPTFTYNVFIFLQIFNEINARCLEPYENPFADLISNYIFIFTNLFVVVCQFLIVNNLNLIFNTHKLSLNNWIISVMLAFTITGYFFMVRMFMKIRFKKHAMEQNGAKLEEPIIPLTHSYKESEIISLDL